MAKNLKVDLVIVDPQNDFMGADDGSPLQEKLPSGLVRSAALPVKGGVSDMKRLAALVDRIGAKLNDIHVTLDSHQSVDVAHPGMWADQNGRQPSPFTIISADDIRNDIWRPRNPGYRKRLLAYSEALASKGNYPLMVWPEHCLIGSWGHAVQEDLYASLQKWARKEVANIDWVVKGTNPFTEHYGGLEAEVPDPQDPSTQLNTGLVKTVEDADLVLFAGEALSHCDKATIEQFARYMGSAHVKKFVLLTDCMSPVPQTPGGPDFPGIGAQFLKDMAAQGATLTTSDQFLV